jgi:hypothetical protein
MSPSRITVVPIDLVPGANSTPELPAALLLVAAAAQQKAQAERVSLSLEDEFKPARAESGE